MPRPVFERQAANTHLPSWVRVWAWALANADQHGHARAYPGQLRDDLGYEPGDISRAIRKARERRLIDECSNAGCLVLLGQGKAPCSANHRGGV